MTHRVAIVAFLIEEVRKIIPPAIFFLLGFNLLVLTTSLLVHGVSLSLANFLLATTGALIAAKAVLVADRLPFFRRYDTAPLVQPVLFKSTIYVLVTAVVRILELVVEFLGHGGAITAMPHYLASQFKWDHFLAVQLWIFVLFLVYTLIAELNSLFGDGEMARILFRWRSTELRLSRRQRIRTLAKLSRLADAHTAQELRNPATAAHAEMMSLIRSLARHPEPPRTLGNH